MFFKIDQLLIVSSAFITLTCGQESPCVGCPKEQDKTDAEVHCKLIGILATANSPHKMKSVISIHKQGFSRAYINSVNVTHDGSITILVSSSPTEGSTFRLMDGEGNMVCRVDSAILKEAMDVRRRWNARYNQANNLVFSKPKSHLKTLFDEIGSLPRPNWSFVGISLATENQGAEVSLPVDATLSAPHLFVISGNSLFPSNLVEDFSKDTTSKCYCNIALVDIKKTLQILDTTANKSASPYMRSINMLSVTSSSNSSYSGSMSLESSSGLMLCSCSHDQFTAIPPTNYPIRLLQKEANQCVSYKILENAYLEIALQSYKTCQCIDGTEIKLKHFGPWTLAISKSLLKDLKKIDTDWRRKAKLEGPVWPPDELYQIKSSHKDNCLREGIQRKKVSEVLEYIMDTNTDKFHSESPITVRLAWFMEKQLKNTELVNPVYEWNTEQVLKWIRNTLELPQYQTCFETNGIRGRHLVLLDAERLEQMGIRDFRHILEITSAIRKMFKTQREKNIWKEVTEARYDPLTLHAMYNYRSVTKRVPIYDFFIDHHFINRKIPHYSLFELRRPVWDVFPRNVRTAKPKLFFKQNFEEHPDEKKCYKIQAKW